MDTGRGLGGDNRRGWHRRSGRPEDSIELALDRRVDKNEDDESLYYYMKSDELRLEAAGRLGTEQEKRTNLTETAREEGYSEDHIRGLFNRH